MSTSLPDPFFAQYDPQRPRPSQVPFAFQKGDRLLLIGDSITAARRFARMLETSLTVCRPDLEVEVRNVGKGGETADEFQLNPFSVACRRIDDLILQKQTFEVDEAWHVWEQTRTPAAEAWAECEARREALLSAIHRALVPVTHNVRLEALP